MATQRFVTSVVFLLALSSSPLRAQRTGPVINDRYPIKNPSELSPPIVSPVGQCAKAVHVSGYIPHAVIKVFANHIEQIGIANPYFAETDVPLTRELKLGDIVTATQTVLSFTSAESTDPVKVGPYPATLNKPVAGPDLYACGELVPVNNLNPGTHVTVFQPAATQIGQGDATQAWQPIVTSSLNATQTVTAIQTACGDIPANKIVSLPSNPVAVHTDPTPVPAPSVEPFPVGADSVVLDGLLVGSAVTVFDNGAPTGGGLSNDSRDAVPISPSANSGAHIAGQQKLCSPSAISPPQTPVTTLPPPVIVPPVCEGTHSVTVENTYVNSIVVLFRNGSIAGMAGGELHDFTMNLGGGASFAFGDQIHLVEYVGSITTSSPTVYVGCANVITQHNDNSRSGHYAVETHLTPANVRPATFGRLYQRSVTGDVVGQALYMRGVLLPATGLLKNLFFSATSTNDVFAFDADDTTPGAAPVWHRNLCNSVKSGVCGETYTGFVGVTSTPVIDPISKTMYVVARCSDGSGGPRDGQVVIYSLDVATGFDRIAPVVINATAPGTNVQFDYHCQRNRPGLLLQNGIVYVGFATFSCDGGCASSPYHGWVIGYRATDLTQVAVYCTSPSNAGGRGEAGIWQTGKGLVGSADGSLFFQTGNGPDGEPLQNSFVKVSPATPGGLANAGHFRPNNAAVAINPSSPGNRSLADGDTDLGSGGPLLLPGGRLIGGGKQGRLYVLDTGSMNPTQDAAPDSLGYDGFQAFTNTYHADSTRVACPVKEKGGDPSGCDISGGMTGDNQCYIAPIRYGDGELCGPNIHSGPVYFQPNASFGLIYEMPEKDFLKAFKYDLTSRLVSEAPFAVASGTLAKPPMDGMPGGYTSVSSNAEANGVVWTSMPDGDGQWNLVPGRIAAFDALTLKQIWSDDANAMFAKSIPPTIADGKVFRVIGGFPGSIIVYGLTVAGGAGAHAIRETTSIQNPPPATCQSIQQKYADYGGRTASVIGAVIGDERPVGDSVGGRYQEFKGSVFGMASTVTSQKDNPADPIPTCSVPKGVTMTVLSSIYWTKNTCAQVVMGEIRDLWIKQGGTKGKLGYPIGDETNTPDHAGRMSRFQNGEIWWYPNKGAYVKPR